MKKPGYLLLLFLAWITVSSTSASVLTQSNDNSRSGLNGSELKLNTTNVKQSSFGKLFEIKVDDDWRDFDNGNWETGSQIVAQPLFCESVQFPDGTVHDILIVCTMHNTIYAYGVGANDRAASGGNAKLLWAQWLGRPMRTVDNPPMDIWGTNPEWGILSTPVIDKTQKAIYLCCCRNGQNPRNYFVPKESCKFELQARSLVTGQELGRTTISGSMKYIDQHHHTKTVSFTPHLQKQRPGLLLIPTNSPQTKRVILGFGASDDQQTYHGWVIAYDATLGASPMFKYVSAFCTTPNGNKGGVWQAGRGITADDSSNLYLCTGNGDFSHNATSDVTSNLGQCLLKISPDLRLLGYFSPWNKDVLTRFDKDLGASGPTLLSNGFLVFGGKEGKLYCLDKNHLPGTFASEADEKAVVPDEEQVTNSQPPSSDYCFSQPGHCNHIHGGTVTWANSTETYIYVWGENEKLKSYKVSSAGKLTFAGYGKARPGVGMPGGMLSVSANGTDDSSAIVWALVTLHTGAHSNERHEDANKTKNVRGVLRAFRAIPDASNELKELWNSELDNNDSYGYFAKFSPPTVGGGMVFVPTYNGHNQAGKIVVYGLRN